MDVAEAADPQLHQRLLRGLHQTPGRGARGDVRQHDQRGGDRAQREDEPRPEAAVEPVIEDLLDQDRHEQHHDGLPERDDDGEPEAAAEGRALSEALHEHRGGAAQVHGDGKVLLLGRGRDLDLGRRGDAHRSPRSYARAIAA